MLVEETRSPAQHAIQVIVVIAALMVVFVVLVRVIATRHGLPKYGKKQQDPIHQDDLDARGDGVERTQGRGAVARPRGPPRRMDGGGGGIAGICRDRFGDRSDRQDGAG